SDPPEFIAAAPVGKIPALVTDDGTLITESTTISEYLDEIGGGRRLIDGDRTRVMARASLAQGIADAGFAIVIERRRPAERQWPEWIDRQRRALDRTLAMVTGSGDRFDLGDIALACGLAYLDFRLREIPWRSTHPALAAWLDRVNQRESMKATAP
ncbi:MAG: glutathione S-transferase N-terminal domain-containing protein, partial [Rhodospirillales bacterium]|nr:glutathione S-transferase N-terminal domain-containing protein [Rhodospirillales bacterium]